MWDILKPWIFATLFVFGLLALDAWLDSEDCFTDTCVEEME